MVLLIPKQLNLNGEVHLAPYSTKIGQKINVITGVSSTYSLAYTGDIYAGAVMAPNGDVHFINGISGSTIGQKVSMDGVVSTYSILTSRCIGGVLGLDGCIHWATYTMPVGQKIVTLYNVPVDPAICFSPFIVKY